MVNWSGLWTLLVTILIAVGCSVCAGDDTSSDGRLKSLQLISAGGKIPELPPYYPEISEKNENFLGPDSAKCPAYAFETVFGPSSPFGSSFIKAGGKYSDYSQAAKLFSGTPLPKIEWNSLYQQHARNPLCKKFIDSFAEYDVNVINRFTLTVSQSLEEMKKEYEQQIQQGKTEGGNPFIFQSDQLKENEQEQRKTEGGNPFIFKQRSRRYARKITEFRLGGIIPGRWRRKQLKYQTQGYTGLDRDPENPEKEEIEQPTATNSDNPATKTKIKRRPAQDEQQKPKKKGRKVKRPFGFALYKQRSRRNVQRRSIGYFDWPTSKKKMIAKGRTGRTGIFFADEQVPEDDEEANRYPAPEPEEDTEEEEINLLPEEDEADAEEGLEGQSRRDVLCKNLEDSHFSARYFKDTLLGFSNRLMKRAPSMAEDGSGKCVFAAVQQMAPVCYFHRVNMVIQDKYCSTK